MLSLSNLLTRGLVQLFSEINLEPEPERRARLFAAGLDRLINTYLGEGTPS